MARFIAYSSLSKKVIKVPRYKILIGLLVIILIIIVIFNVIISIFLNNIDQRIVIQALKGNSLGVYALDKEVFFQNSFGLNMDIKEEDNTSVFNNNIQDIVEKEPIIYLYNTYQTDKYQNNYKASYNINSYAIQSSYILNEYLKDEDIYSVVETKRIASVLKELNLTANYPYEASRFLLQKALEEYPSLNYFLDLQIGNKEEKEVVLIDNLEYAKILFVVGRENPNYLNNLELAQTLNNLLKKINPTLSLGVELRAKEAGFNGLYNQDLNNNILLLEVGNKADDLENVNRTLKIFSQVIKEYLGDKNG